MSELIKIVSPAPIMSKQEYCDYTGFSVGRIEGWIKRKQWVKGEQYNVKGRTTGIDREEADKWLLERFGRQASEPAAKVSELPSTGRERFAMTRPYPVTTTVRLT